MAITFNAIQRSSGDGTNVVIAVPTGSVGDLLVAALQWSQGPGVTPPAGWTLLDDLNTPGGIRQATYWHIYATEPASYTWTLDTAVEFAALIADYAGTHATAPIEVLGHSGQTNGGSSTITCPSVLTQNNNDWLLCFYGQNDASGNLAPAAGQTQRADIAGTSLCHLLLADEALGSAGSTGSRVGNSTSTLANIGITLAVTAAVGGGGPPASPPTFKPRLKRRRQKNADRRQRRPKPGKVLFKDGPPPPITPLEYWGRRRRRPRAEIKPAQKQKRFWRGRHDPVVTDKPRAMLGQVTVFESFSGTAQVTPGS